MVKKRLKTRKEHLKAILDYHKNYYSDGGFPNIFSLQQKMLDLGICPRCGTKSRCWSSNTGHFPCWECGFKITETEIDKVLDEESPSKRILLRRIKTASFK